MKCLFLFVALGTTAWASAVDVLVLSSGDVPTDAAVVSALATHGHTATIGPSHDLFDGTMSLAGYEAIYFQLNANWASPDMPGNGQLAIGSYVANGGGLIFSEWCTWKMAVGQLQGLAPLAPYVITPVYGFDSSVTFGRVTGDPVVSQLLPFTFTVPLDSYSGTHVMPTSLVPGALHFYAIQDAFGTSIGLAGRRHNLGRVAAFSTTNGPTQLANSNFRRLFSNTVQWVSSGDVGVPVSGTVHLQDWIPSQSGVGVDLVFSQGGIDMFTYPSAPLDGSGAFSVTMPLQGVFEVYAKGPHWLRRSHGTLVTVGPTGANGLSFSLINGDVDGNNTIDSDDFDRLVAGFGYALGDAQFDAATDLNGTDNTDSDDFDILVANFGLGGD